MSADKIKKIKVFRDLEISKLNEILAVALEAKTDALKRNNFKIRFEELDDIRTEYSKKHAALLNEVFTDPDEVKDGSQKLHEFQKNVAQIKEIYDDLFLIDLTTQQRGSRRLTINPHSPGGTSHENDPSYNLPRINLIKFNGELGQFPAFYDMFKTVIHDNPNISNIQKYSTLITYLEGPPKELVCQLPASDANYPIVFNNLVKRYKNDRLLAQNYWSAIENAQKVNSDDPIALRNLLDTFTKNIEALKTVGLEPDLWDFVLAQKILKCVDSTIHTRFEVSHGKPTQIPSYRSIFNFLDQHCNALFTVNASVNLPKNNAIKNIPKSQTAHNTRQSSRAYFSTNNISHTNINKCPNCSREHTLSACPDYLAKSPQQRFNFLKEKKWCINCTSHMHKTIQCKSAHTCRFCKKRHHTSVHFNSSATNAVNADIGAGGVAVASQPVPTSPSAIQLEFENAPHSNNFTCMSSHQNTSSVLLSTAVFEMQDVRGQFQTVRGILDTGSQLSFLSLKCANKLGLPRNNINTDVQGIGDINLQAKMGSVNVIIRPRNKSNLTLTLNAIILPQICSNLPNSDIKINDWKIIKNINLADPNFNKPGTIDALIGADLFPYIIQDGRIVGNDKEPIALNTIFGYILMGKINSDATKQTSFSLFCQISNKMLNDSLTKFWELENIPETKPILAPEDELCEQIFKNTVSRNDEGRYIVTLPFRNNIEPIFQNSRDLALKRFLSLERRLSRTPETYKKYSDFMQEYLDLDHMELIKNTQFTDKSYYIPHHHIERPESLSTKLRVVFNASAVTQTLNKKISLNDTLYAGPKLQRDICTILLNFRLHKVALCCDITKMFRCIRIAPHHQDYQRILWRFNRSEPIREYKLKTVTYGTAPAPYLALRVLQQLAEDEKHNYPRAVKVLMSDTFVDDFVTGCNSIEEAISLQKELTLLLNAGGFKLHKWMSNNKAVLEHVPETDTNPTAKFLDSDETTKILGLRYQPCSDYFSYSVDPISHSCTKRNMLSDIFKVYDPLGWLSPITIKIKCLIQELWKLKLDWDSEAPCEIIRIWERYRSELSLLKQFYIPRFIDTFSGKAQYEIHGFSDASNHAYAAIVYLRVIYENNISIYFLCSKTRVAPIKFTSIARLELAACNLLSNLIQFVLNSFMGKLNIHKTFAWSDSQVALSWIKTHPSRWKTFVQNRVTQIHDKISPENWHYISTLQNPSDVASRGLYPSEFINHTLFLNGPDFLKVSYEQWPINHKIIETPETVLEEKPLKTVSLVAVQNNKAEVLNNLLKNFSSFSSICRILAYILRFKNNYFAKNPENKIINDFLTCKEVINALHLIIKNEQSIYFYNEINSIKNKVKLSKPMQKLNLFLDPFGILRVGGRLHHSSLSYDKKFPILLPRKSRITYLLIQHFHEKYLHAGVRTVHFLLSELYWIISAKREVRHVLSKCVRCFRVNPKSIQPMMGSLPFPRVSQLRAFLHSGVDFAGPLTITMNRCRGGKTLKAYLCLFVCLSTKCIHIEIASDLTADTFIAALRRFVARRNYVTDMYSDNATNFISANKKLLQLDPTHPIKWHFIPSSSPNFGGLWESGIKSVKKHLIRIIGSQILTYEELYTVTCQIEAVLNSRPLTELSTDPNDLSVLTPGHFLSLEPLSAVPDTDLTNVKINRLTRWQLLQRIHQDFWKRWQQEYLHTLQQRSKWLEPTSTPNVGQLVIIKNELFSPLQWQLGRITEVFPGKDGINRVALVKTKDTVLKRPISKLCPLPIDNLENA